MNNINEQGIGGIQTYECWQQLKIGTSRIQSYVKTNWGLL